jgi:hypothetical protein
MSATPPISVGLGGDGDEIVAIDDVERAFGVKLDKADAAQWHTASDVFVSLCKAATRRDWGRGPLVALCGGFDRSNWR